MTQPVGPYARKTVQFNEASLDAIKPKNGAYTHEQLAGLSDEQLAALVKKHDKTYFGIKQSVWYYIGFECCKVGVVIALLVYFFYISDSFKPKV